MRILKKYENGGIPFINKEDGDGTETYNPIDISNNGLGVNGKNKTYTRGSTVGESSIVLLENPWEINNLSWLIRDFDYESQKTIFGVNQNSPKRHYNVPAVIYRKNADGTQEITSIIMETTSGRHIEIVNPHTSERPDYTKFDARYPGEESKMEIYEFNLNTRTGANTMDPHHFSQSNRVLNKPGQELLTSKETGRPTWDYNFPTSKNLLAETRSGENMLSGTSTYKGHFDRFKSKFWGNIIKEYSQDVKQHFSSEEYNTKWDTQKLNYTNFLMPITNTERNNTIDRPETTMDDMVEQMFKSRVGGAYAKSEITEENPDGKFRSLRIELPTEYQTGEAISISNAATTSFSVNLDKGNGFSDFGPQHIKQVMAGLMNQFVQRAGRDGKLQGMYNSDGELDLGVLKEAGIHINYVDGQPYLSMDLDIKDNTWKNVDNRGLREIINLNLRLDDDNRLATIFKTSLENSLVTHSNYMQDATDEAYRGKGNHFNTEGKNLTFNVDAKGLLNNDIVVTQKVKEFTNVSEAKAEAEAYNNIDVSMRTRPSSTEGESLIKYKEVVEEEGGTVFQVKNFNQNASDSKYDYKPIITEYTSRGTAANYKEMEKIIKNPKIKINRIVTPGGGEITKDNLKDVKIATENNDSGIITNEDLDAAKVETGGSMGDWSNEELAELNRRKGYTIKKGDTLTKIARENKTTTEEIMLNNPNYKGFQKDKSGDLIYTGDTLSMGPEMVGGVPSFRPASEKNQFGGIPAGTEQNYDKIYFDGAIHNWDESNKQWTPVETEKKDEYIPTAKSNKGESSLTSDTEEKIILSNIKSQGSNVTEIMENVASSSAKDNLNMLQMYKKYQELEGEKIKREEDNDEEEKKEEVPIAYQKSAGSYVDESGEMIPQSQLGGYSVQEMKTGGMVLPKFVGGGTTLLEQMTDPNRRNMFASGYLGTIPEKKEKKKDDDKEKTTTTIPSQKEEGFWRKYKKKSGKSWRDVILERKARKQRTKVELQKSGEWKKLTPAERRATIQSAKKDVESKEYQYKKGSGWKNPNE